MGIPVGQTEETALFALLNEFFDGLRQARSIDDVNIEAGAAWNVMNGRGELEPYLD